MKVLTVSDVVDNLVYSPQIRNIYGDVEVVFGCGDLPYYYLEYIVSALDKPVFFVRGNHAHVVEYGEDGAKSPPSWCDQFTPEGASPPGVAIGWD